MPRGGQHGNIPKSRSKVYERLRGKLGKTRAAKIAQAGRTRAGRSRMARKSARTRKRRGG